MPVVSHYDIRPVIDIYGSVQGRDLGAVARQINQIIAETQSSLPRGSQVIVRGQVRTMRSSYIGLLAGLAFSIMLVYLLIVVNFQSWLDPFIIISALPAALAGIAWFLFVSHTTVSVPALTGTIMCMGVATANSILVVSFATEQMQEGKDAIAAALRGRVHPISSGADDRPGHDHRHGTDGAGIGRRRRAECAAGPRGNRRPALCHGCNFTVRANAVQPAAWIAPQAERSRTKSVFKSPGKKVGKYAGWNSYEKTSDDASSRRNAASDETDKPRHLGSCDRVAACGRRGFDVRHPASRHRPDHVAARNRADGAADGRGHPSRANGARRKKLFFRRTCRPSSALQFMPEPTAI